MIRAMIGHVTRYMFRVRISLSVLFNVILGGHVNQTFSARNYQRKKDGKFNLVRLIDFIFGDKHCVISWVYWKYGG